MLPTVGRIVHYYKQADMFNPKRGPFAAIVADVVGESVSLHIFEPNQQSYSKNNVPFFQEPNLAVNGVFACWPPRVE